MARISLPQRDFNRSFLYVAGRENGEEETAVWKSLKPHQRILWEVADSEAMDIKKFIPDTKTGLTKNQKDGARFVNPFNPDRRYTFKLAETGAIVSFATVCFGLIKSIGVIVEVSSWSSFDDVDPELVIDVILKLTLLLLGIAGLKCFHYNKKIFDEMGGDIPNKHLSPLTDDELDVSLNETCSFMKTSFKSNIRTNGPRSLLIGFAVFLVNDIVDLASEWLNLLIESYGNPNYPFGPPPDVRPSFAPSNDLLFATAEYIIVVIVLGYWVFGWLLSWWEVLRVGFVNYKDIKFSGYSSKRAQMEGTEMKKLIFTTGFEGKSCFEMAIIQIENRFGFQRRCLLGDETYEDALISGKVGVESHQRDVRKESCREIMTAITMYGETCVKTTNINGLPYVFGSSRLGHSVITSHTKHNSHAARTQSDEGTRATGN